MKSLNKATPYIVGLAILGGIGSAWIYADPDLTDPPSRAPAKTPDPSLTKISQADMSTRLATLDVQVKDDNRHVLHLQSMARKQKDVIKLNCINDKLVQLKAQERIFDSAHVELVPLLDSRNPSEDANRFSMFEQVTLGAQNVHKLRTEADACIGEPEIAGESKNSFSGPTLSDDPTQGDVFGHPVEPPGYASPYN